MKKISTGEFRIIEKGNLTQLRKARAGSRIVSGVFQVDREMEECPRQRDHHVQRHRGGRKHRILGKMEDR